MPEKRSHDDNPSAPPTKKQKKGFQIGPANLPDGAWRRKNQRIKADLIEKAQIKKSYAKLRQKERIEKSRVRYDDDEDEEKDVSEEAKPVAASMELHPDRQRKVDEGDEAVGGDARENDNVNGFRSRRRQRPVPFEREVKLAEKQQKEADERARQREEAKKERERKLEEREKFRRAMAKARTGGKNGQRKLGRESTVLLAKIKRMVGET